MMENVDVNWNGRFVKTWVRLAVHLFYLFGLLFNVSLSLDIFDLSQSSFTFSEKKNKTRKNESDVWEQR